MKKTRANSGEKEKKISRKGQEIGWGLIRFIPNTLIGEFLNVGIVVYQENEPPRITFGNYLERIRDCKQCSLSDQEIEDEIKRFVDDVEGRGEKAETMRVFQELDQAVVRVSTLKQWEERVLSEFVPS